MVIEELQLRHDLSDAEMAGLARKQANCIETLKVTKSDLDAIKKDFGGRIALAEAEVGSISSKVNAGWELRGIKCLLVDERPEGYRVVVRTDNGHIERRRQLQPEERQMKLSTDQPKPYTVSVILKVDDTNWDVDFYELPLHDDEAEALRHIPGLDFKAMRRAGYIAAPKDDKKKK